MRVPEAAPHHADREAQVTSSGYVPAPQKTVGGHRCPLTYSSAENRPKPWPVDTTPNRLLYGDNIRIMEQMKSESVDLIYLDPPFNSSQTYNLMYRTMTGRPVPEQAEAFFDTWQMTADQWAMLEEMPVLVNKYDVETLYGELWRTWLYALKDTQPKLLSYLLYMLRRLLQMKLILKPTGSIYLHCDPTASHYLKVLMDGIFGHQNFRNEIIWERTTGRKSGRQFGRVHDTILFYTKGKDATWNPPTVKQSESTVRGHDLMRDANGLYRLSDLSGAGQGPARVFGSKGSIDPPSGRHWMFDQAGVDRLLSEGRIAYSRTGTPRLKTYLKDLPGIAVRDLWTDIEPLNSAAGERLGYQTQKPIALLKRIIEASSKPGDIVFDPFCGCGTTVYAAHEAERKWLGCDITVLAIDLVKTTLHKRYGLREDEHFGITGIPVSVAGAEMLFEEDPAEFQAWAIQRIGGLPMKSKTNDRGIDGRLYYEAKPHMRAMVLQVKGGKNIGSGDIRDLRGVLERERDVDMAGFISLREPTREMQREAREAGVFTYNGVDYPRIQMLTIREILEEKREFRSPARIGNRNTKGQVSLPI